MNREQRREAWSSYGDHLRTFQWDYYVTLTSGLPSTPRALGTRFEKIFHRQLCRAAQRGVAWFYAVETGTGGRAHIHALLWCGGKKSLSRSIQRAWRIGRVDVRGYDSERNAAHYVTKAIHDEAQQGWSELLPPLLAELESAEAAA